jgi:hypothetical protein
MNLAEHIVLALDMPRARRSPVQETTTAGNSARIALGTSMPDLVICLVATVKKEPQRNPTSRSATSSAQTFSTSSASSARQRWSGQ